MPHHAGRHRKQGRNKAVRRAPDYGAVRLAASIEAHPDVKQQRSDARRYAVELLRIVARTLQSGEMQHLRLNVPADPITASVLGASLYRIAYEIEEHGQRKPQPAPHAGRRRPRRGETADERPCHHVNTTASAYTSKRTGARRQLLCSLPGLRNLLDGGSCARGTSEGAVVSSGRPRAGHYPHGRCSSPSEACIPSRARRGRFRNYW